MPWTFNGDYNDLAQVTPFIEDYWTILDEIIGAGKYPYNDSFRGRIPGLADADVKRGPNVGTHEEAAIYLLQSVRHLVEGHETLASILDAGYQRVTSLDARSPVRYTGVVVLDQHYRKQEYPEARLVPDTAGELERMRPAPTHGIVGVLPKGKRTRGRRIEHYDQVYVK